MKTGLKLLLRDWRGGELGLLLVSLILATATITCISLFASRIHNSLYDEASQFLAGDAQISGSAPIPTPLQNEAAQQNLQGALTIQFRAMVFSDESMHISATKAVAASYPLKGQIQIADTPFGAPTLVNHGPAEGEVWLASRLFGALAINIGDTVQIGEANFKATAAIIKEPDNAQSLFGVAPRALIHINDVEKTQAIQLGSRVNYTWMLAGDSSSVETFKQYFEANKGEHHRWVDIHEQNRSVGSALNRAESFLLLAGSLGVVLCGLAIALAARRYAMRQATNVALLKTFGQTPNKISRLYCGNLLALGVVGILPGAVVGWALHWGIIFALQDLLPNGLASASVSALFIGAGSGIVALAAFAAPPILSLRQVSPAAVIRLDSQSTLNFGWLSWLPGVLAIIGLIFWYSQSLQLTLVLTLGLAVCCIGISICARLIILASRVTTKKLTGSWRLGLANLQRHRQMNSVQILVFSTLLMLLFTLTLTRTSLISQWQNQIPEGTPNHFVFNIFSEDRTPIAEKLASAQVEHSPFYPMMRGRLIEVNGVTVKDILETEEVPHNYARELNLTWSNTLGSDNKIEQGEWWQTNTARPQGLYVSAEQEYATGLNMQLGDVLTFSISGERVNAELASIRSVQWDSMNPNFYMIFDRTVLDGTAANWLTSFYLAPEQKPFLNDLIKTYPTVSVIELDQLIAQLQSIVNQVTLAVEFILMLVLAAGVLVLVSSVQATLDVRMQESAILRTLGAPKRLVGNILLIEFGALGALAGLLAAVGTETAFYFLQTRVFNLQYQPQPIMWLVAPFIGAALIGAVGWASTRKVVHIAPAKLLREIG